jgi:hypothetical protein
MSRGLPACIKRPLQGPDKTREFIIQRPFAAIFAALATTSAFFLIDTVLQSDVLRETRRVEGVPA